MRLNHFYKLVLSVCIFTTIIELFSYIFFTLNRDKLLTNNPHDYTLTTEVINYYSQFYDKFLGWDISNDTKYGERRSIRSYDNIEIASFGDSFTFGSDVENNCTWQEFLESKRKKDILNFGVGGYGIDQAYLKFQTKAKLLKETSVVMLSFIPGDINRNMNNYRYFIHTFEGGMFLTKPFFRLNQKGDIDLVKNPISTRSDLQNLHEVAFIRSLQQNDWWNKRFHFAPWKFPYIASMIKKSTWQQLENQLDLAPWFDQEALNIFKLILKKFDNEVNSMGSKLAITLFPDFNMLSKWNDSDHKMQKINKTFIHICRELNLNCYNPAVYLLDNFNIKELFVKPEDSSHYSCLGNQAVADYFNTRSIFNEHH